MARGARRTSRRRRRSTSHDGTRRRPRLQRVVVGGDSPRESDRERPRPRASSSPAAAWSGVDTDKIRVAHQFEARARASHRRSSGPLIAIHASLACGRPIDFDRPPSVKPEHVGPAGQTPAAASRAGVELVVGEHLVGDDARRRATGRARRSRRARPVETKLPVGLLGLTTSTARVLRAECALERGEVDRPARRDTRGRTAPPSPRRDG